MGSAPNILTGNIAVSGYVTHVTISGNVEYDSVIQIYRYSGNSYTAWGCPFVTNSGIWHRDIDVLIGNNYVVATAHDLVSESDYSNMINIYREPWSFGRGLTNNIITSIGEYLEVVLSGTTDFADVSVLGDRDIDYEKIIESGSGYRSAIIPFIVYHIWEVSSPEDVELAGRNYMTTRRLELHFFEKTVALRNSLGDFLYQLFVSNEIPLYDYAEGRNNKIRIGTIVFDDVRWATYGQMSPELAILRKAGYLYANLRVMERRW